MTSIEICIMAGAIFFTSALTTSTGVGGGSLLLALMLQFMTPAAAIPIHGAMQTFANGWRIWLLRENMMWPIILRFSILMPLGIAAGLWLFREMTREWVEILIGGFILITLFTQSLKSLRHKELPLWAFVPAGLVVGALNIIIGVVGPVLSTLLVGRVSTRQNIVSTTAVFSFLGHFMKVVGFTFMGFSFADYAPAMAAMVPSIVLGTYAGRFLLGRISDRVFKNLLRVILAALAVKLAVWDGFIRGFI